MKNRCKLGSSSRLLQLSFACARVAESKRITWTALEARRLLDMSSEVAAEWVDKNLPPHPNAESFTGYSELPPRPPSFPTPPPSTSSSDTIYARGSSEALARVGAPSAPSPKRKLLPPIQPLYDFILSNCPLTLADISIDRLLSPYDAYNMSSRFLSDSTEVSFSIRGTETATKAYEELNGMKMQGEAINAEYAIVDEGDEGDERRVVVKKWIGRPRIARRPPKRKSPPLPPAEPPLLNPCRSKQLYRSQQLQNDHKEEESQEPETLLFNRSRPSPQLSKKPKLVFNLGWNLQLAKKTSIVLDTEVAAVAAPSEFANGRLETENENLMLYEQTPEWPEAREESEKKEVSWKGIGEKVEREVKEVVGTKRRIDLLS